MKSNSTYLVYPGGMLMPGRFTTSGDYRYGYNGMEMDNETSGNGNSYTTEFRQYDPRLMRWKSLDPLMVKYPNMSPYVAFNNNSIFYIDPFGLEGDPLNVIILIFDQEEIDFNLINSGDVIGDFTLIVATNINDANKELNKQLTDGQCVDKLVLSAHGGAITLENGEKQMYFFINMENAKANYTEQTVSALDIYYYKRKPENLNENKKETIASLEGILMQVDEDGNVLFLSCNLADDVNLMSALAQLNGGLRIKYLFNGDRSQYPHDNCSFVSNTNISLTANGELDRGWFELSLLYGLKSLKEINEFNCKTGGLRMDVNLTKGVFVIPEEDKNCGNNEMEDTGG